MSLPRYEHYRESGELWLGDIPAGWAATQLRRVANLVTERAESRSRQLALENIEPWTGRLIETGGTFDGDGVAFKAGDVLYGKLRPYLAKTHAAKFSGEAVGDFHIIRPRSELDAGFLTYALLTREVVSILDGSTIGAKMPRVAWDMLAGLPLALPGQEEQAAIAAFLDRETAKIDALVEAQRRLIELLKEKRQAVISHAVTMGLDPSAPMKVSGLEWPTLVPAHWEVLPLTRVVRQFVDYRGATPTKIDDGVPLITATQIKEGKIDHSLDPVFISEAEYATRMTRGLPAQGAMLLTTEAPLGEVAQIDDDRVAPGQRMILMKVERHKLTNDFLFEHFRSEFGQNELWTRASGSTASGIRSDRLRAGNVLVPPLAEQIGIVDHIRAKITGFMQLQGEAQAVITLLQERRSALISAAVTGKIDVRGLVSADVSEAA